jgi:hypothetical protein
MALGGCHDDFSCSLHPVGYNPHFLCVAAASCSITAGGPIRPTMEEVQEKKFRGKETSLELAFSFRQNVSMIENPTP